jgi:hypothetical protein
MKRPDRGSDRAFSRSDYTRRGQRIPPLLPGGVVVPPVVPLSVEPLPTGAFVAGSLVVVPGVVDGVLTELPGVRVRLDRVVERLFSPPMVLEVSSGWPVFWPVVWPVVWPCDVVWTATPPGVPPDTCASAAAGIKSAPAAITCM